MGNRIYGCDDCLAVCPWNKFAAAASQLKLQARADLLAPRLAELARLNDAAFRPEIFRLAGQAHRSWPLRAQRPDRHRQLG
jgi:epoxyqueuosine reductase QueG